MSNDLVFHVTELVNTFHGEYPNVGKLTTLVRFRFCNLSCPFCDTREKTNQMYRDPKLSQLEGNEAFLLALISKVRESRGLLITGGEPGLYSNYVSNMVEFLFESNIFLSHVQIETNGLVISTIDTLLNGLSTTTRYGLNQILTIVWSPKFVDEKETEQNFIRLYSTEFRRLLDYSFVKLVDVPSWRPITENFVKTGSELYGLHFKERCSLMPCTKTDEEQDGSPTTEDYSSVMETLEKALELGINISPRIHLSYKFP